MKIGPAVFSYRGILHVELLERRLPRFECPNIHSQTVDVSKITITYLPSHTDHSIYHIVSNNIVLNIPRHLIQHPLPTYQICLCKPFFLCKPFSKKRKKKGEGMFTYKCIKA